MIRRETRGNKSYDNSLSYTGDDLSLPDNAFHHMQYTFKLELGGLYRSNTCNSGVAYFCIMYAHFHLRAETFDAGGFTPTAAAASMAVSIVELFCVPYVYPRGRCKSCCFCRNSRTRCITLLLFDISCGTAAEVNAVAVVLELEREHIAIATRMMSRRLYSISLTYYRQIFGFIDSSLLAKFGGAQNDIMSYRN